MMIVLLCPSLIIFVGLTQSKLTSCSREQSIQLKFATIITIMQPNSQSDRNGLIVLDIGGTLSKVCFVTHAQEVDIAHDPRLTIKLQKQTLFFNYFKIVEECWHFLRTNFGKDDCYSRIIITGGGAYKYSEELTTISKETGKQVSVVQEFQSLVGGLTFFKVNSKCQQFLESFISHEQGKSKFQNRIVNYGSIDNSPILVVNIGSGVSILLVENNEKGELKAERVGGTSLGGGFFMGLANLLVGENNFHKLLEMAQKGDIRYTDFTPTDFPEVNDELSDASVLVSLGKLNKDSNPNDIVRSLFFMVTFNIAQIALSYSQIKNVKHVLFTGFYCRGNNFFLQCFTEAFNFFSKTKKTSPRFVYSMIHDGFLGTLGALQLELTKTK